jgi:hypothetical protein
MTRSGLVYSVMNANASLPMDEVLALIVEADAKSGIAGKVCDLKRAKAYYTHAVKNGLANGVGATKVTRAPKAKAAPKSAKPKLIKVPKPKVQGDKPKITDKTVEEIADIRAKNLARLKAVGRKYAKGQYADGASGRIHTDEEARAVVANLEAELDSFKAPAFLNMDQVKALV